MDQNQAEDFMERIRQTESLSINKFARFFTEIKIKPTYAYSGEKMVHPVPAFMEFHPDTYFRIFILSVIVVLLIKVSYNVFRPGMKDLALTVLGFVAIIILIGTLYSAVRDYFFNKTKSYSIRIDHNGINIGKNFYKWEDIGETAILTKSTWGPSETKYLILACNDLKTYEKFELTHFVHATFHGFSATLSNYIEYYKAFKKTDCAQKGIAGSGTEA